MTTHSRVIPSCAPARLLALPLALTLALALLLARPAAAGPLTPPAGPVAPTHKTLTQVEPRTPVSSATTPGDSGAIYKITQPGSYYLTGNITGEPNKFGIVITAPGVTLDLAGFAVRGVPNAYSGIAITSSLARGILITGGTVSDWPDSGILATAANNVTITDVRALDNGSDGIAGGLMSRISGCTARGNGDAGIAALAGSAVSNCVGSENGRGIVVISSGTVTACAAFNNTGNGFQAGHSATIAHCTSGANGGDGYAVVGAGVLTNCTAWSNSGNGFSGDTATTVSNCSAYDNLGDGIRIAADGRVTGCALRANRGFGIKVGLRSLVLRNSCIGNGVNGVGGGGIEVTGQGSRIEDNQLNSNANIGLRVTSNRNVIVRNSAILNASHWDIATGNQTGAFTSDPATAGPWDNLVH